MKKIKMLLSATAVLAVVGGALAFTGKTFQHADVFCNDGATHCTVPVQFQFEVNGDVQSNPCSSGSYGTFSTSAACSSTDPIYTAIDQ